MHLPQVSRPPQMLSISTPTCRAASNTDVPPVGILYRNDDVPCYEDVRNRDKVQTPEMIEEALNEEFDNFTVDPVL